MRVLATAVPLQYQSGRVYNRMTSGRSHVTFPTAARARPLLPDSAARRECGKAQYRAAKSPSNHRDCNRRSGSAYVRNNLQRKLVRVASNGVGLSNILTQYRVMGQPAPTIIDNGQEFSVILPLIGELTSVVSNNSATPV
ncbi:hypothetical protein [Fibrisoma montanum]|uniref:hypothetical protein n=1 Tax=Fibrisoma montanum TaxID=2305895 RepID=UPI0018F68762|nr:hypothetical protein [Fibrisoma montanum]